MKRKNKEILSILIICIMMGLCACANQNAKNENTENNDKQLILFASLEGDFSKKVPGSGKAEDHGLYTPERNEKLENVEQNRDMKFGSKQKLQYTYSECKMKDGAGKEYGDFYCIYDVYESEKEKVKFLHNTDMVCFFTTPFNPDDSYEIMEEKEVKKIADDFLKSIISQENLDKYTYKGMDTDALGRYALWYVRYVEGTPTDETLSVWVDRCGEVSGYNGYNLKKYDGLVEKLSAEKIGEAKEFLQNEIKAMDLSNLECWEPVIVTNTSGELYLQMDFFYQDNEEGITCGETALVKIE